MELMILQMQNEANERAFEQKEQVEDRKQLTETIGTIATSYFMAQEKRHLKSQRRKNIKQFAPGKV